MIKTHRFASPSGTWRNPATKVVKRNETLFIFINFLYTKRKNWQKQPLHPLIIYKPIKTGIFASEVQTY